MWTCCESNTRSLCIRAAGAPGAAHTAAMAPRSWRDRLQLGVAVFIGIAVALLIGPTYLRPLPMWSKLLLIVVGCAFIATVAIYSRRRARRV